MELLPVLGMSPANVKTIFRDWTCQEYTSSVIVMSLLQLACQRFLSGQPAAFVDLKMPYLLYNPHHPS